jgi:hypothetical protein
MNSALKVAISLVLNANRFGLRTIGHNAALQSDDVMEKISGSAG